jgi:heme/copper-type cytochrome/quinol oxidase subunit 2
MKRRLIALLLVGTFLLWLVGSYLLPEVAPWQTMPGEGSLSLFRMAVVGSAALFVLIQLLLVASVFKFPQRVSRHEPGASPDEILKAEDSGEILIKRRWEVVWTAMPLIASFGLFAASYCMLSG